MMTLIVGVDELIHQDFITGSTTKRLKVVTVHDRLVRETSDRIGDAAHSGLNEARTFRYVLV